jgi:dipeptidyl aminopeptidase/acylaminoacyl peptidase
MMSCSGVSDGASARYDVEQVRMHADDGVVLAGEFWKPTGAPTSTAAVIIVSGSGAQDRDATRAELPYYRPSLEIANVLVAVGIAVLRLDDRGAGESGGSANGTTTTMAARDVATAIRWLRSHPAVDSNRVGIIGHSEGGLIALIAAASDTSVQRVVLLATASRNGKEIARWQRRWMAVTDTSTFPPRARERLLDEAERTADREAEENAWLREWFTLEPLEFAAHIHGRVLVIHGERDRQVPVEQSHELVSALRRAGVSVDAYRFPNVDHLMLSDPDGDPRHYVRLGDVHVSKAILETISEWSAEHL